MNDAQQIVRLGVRITPARRRLTGNPDFRRGSVLMNARRTGIFVKRSPTGKARGTSMKYPPTPRLRKVIRCFKKDHFPYKASR